MNIDTERFRQARHRVKFSHRAVAVAAGTSASAVMNLEKTGDVTHLSVGVLTRIASAVGLSPSDLLLDTIRSHTATDRSDTSDAEVISALNAYPGGLRVDALAVLLQEPADAISARLDSMGAALRPLGLGVAIADGTATLVGLPRLDLTDERVREVQRRVGGRADVTLMEAKLAYSVLQGRTSLKSLRSSGSGHLRTWKLVNLGIIRSGPREIDPPELTPEVRYSLLLDELEPADAGS